MNRSAMIKPHRYTPLAIFAATCALLLAACSGPVQAPAAEPPLAGAHIGGPFTLTDKDGRTRRWADFSGRYRLVYFGYTYCPDACPTDVAALMQGFNRFDHAHPKLAAQVQPLFITIDPARDTPAVVGEFAAAFSPRLMGLSGSPEQIAQAARAFAVYYAKGAQSPGGYVMDHSRIAYLMGRKGEPIAILPIDKGPAAVADELALWVH